MDRSGAQLLSAIRGGHCTVLGYGVSNRPLVPWLLSHGASLVTVRDRRTPAQMEAAGDAAILDALGARLVCGEAYLDGLAGDILFRSPGMRPDLPAIRSAVAAGAILSSEMELFLALTPATVIALTGSDGKTTSTTLTARLLEAACARRGVGRVYLGGNIGTPLLSYVGEMTEDDFAVVELSSFQLMTVGDGCIPHRVAITNLSPNHLDWHTDMEEYIAAKAHLLGLCEALPREAPAVSGRFAPTMAVLNARDSHSVALGARLTCPVLWFTGETDLPTGYVPETVVPSRGDGVICERDGIITLSRGQRVTPLLPVSSIRLPGRHNVENFITALALTCTALDQAAPLATAMDAATVAATFAGVPHRLELVAERDGVRCYNSSIDSSPSRTAAALAALRETNGRPENAGRRDPIVICGGRDKRVPFDPLATALCRYASRVILTGESREVIRAAILACPDYDPARLPLTVIPDWQEAMRTAIAIATPGDSVLLSPACTSFDAFQNFEERGEAFRRVAEESMR